MPLCAGLRHVVRESNDERARALARHAQERSMREALTNLRLEALAAGPRSLELQGGSGARVRHRRSEGRGERTAGGRDAWATRQWQHRFLRGMLREAREGAAAAQAQGTPAIASTATQREQQHQRGEKRARVAVMEIDAVAAGMRHRRRRTGNRGAKRKSGYVRQPPQGKRAKAGGGRQEEMQRTAADKAARAAVAKRVRAAQRRRRDQRRERLRRWLQRRELQLRREAAGRFREQEELHRAFMAARVRFVEGVGIVGGDGRGGVGIGKRGREAEAGADSIEGRFIKRSRGATAVAVARSTRL